MCVARADAQSTDAAQPDGGTPSTPAEGDGAVANAEALSAIVMQIEGRVRARTSPDAPWAPVKENDRLLAGAELQTGLRASVALRLGSNATALLDATTSIVIPSLERDGRVLTTRMVVRSGRVDVRVDRVGLDNDFSVLTPSATIAVSGTTLAILNGQLMGTEVTGARSNLLTAIESRWIQRRLAFYFGDGTSNRRFPDPAMHGINRTVAKNLLPGVVDGDEQLEQAWFTGSLQNVEFNINNLQRTLNMDPPVIDEELAALSVLQQLLEIQLRTADDANTADSAAVLVQAFAQKAIQLAAAAEAMLPDIQKVLDAQNAIASDAAKDAANARIDALLYGKEAAEAKGDALQALADTIIALDAKDFEAAQAFAAAASLAALFAADAALNASDSSKTAFSAAESAAQAAAIAQGAIDTYFNKVIEAENCANGAAAQASIASNAAASAQALNQLAQQLGAAAQGQNMGPLLAQIDSNTNQAIAASMAAAISRDQALAAASNARSMGEKTLFNFAAVFASHAAADAALAAVAANQAALDAMEAQAAADLANELVDFGCIGCGKDH